MKILARLFGVLMISFGLASATSPGWFKPVRRYISDSRFTYDLIDPSMFFSIGLFVGGVVIAVVGLVIVAGSPASDNAPEEEH